MKRTLTCMILHRRAQNFTSSLVTGCVAQYMTNTIRIYTRKMGEEPWHQKNRLLYLMVLQMHGIRSGIYTQSSKGVEVTDTTYQ